MVFSSRLPAIALMIIAGVSLIALILGWLLAGRPLALIWAIAPVVPLHLILLATGGLRSPLTPLLIPWLLTFTWAWSLRLIATIGVATLSWLILVEWWTMGIELYPTLQLTLIIGGGVLPAWILKRARRRDIEPPTEFDRLLSGTVGVHEWEPALEQGTTSSATELTGALERAREALGAWRATLWEIDEEADRARPRLVRGGDWPPTVPLTGDPLRLAWEDTITLRLETPPRWAVGSERACIIPIERPGEYTALLTVEYRDETLFPTAELLEETAAQLRAFLDMQLEATLANAARERFSAIVRLLRRLPQKLDPEGFSAELAAAAREFIGFSGAAVASWDGDVGHILALDSDDGGVPPGTVFRDTESEMALAARNMTTIIRQREIGETRALPMIAGGERWHARPRTIVVIPLHGMAGVVVGLLALWNDEPVRVDPDQIEVLQMAAPYAAMQLHQIQVYGPLREYAERDALTGLYNRRIFDDRMEAEESHFLRYRRPTALLILDIDHFKAINDTYGHEAGDQVLRSVGGLLRTTIRGSDLVARFGGEEFVILMPETNLGDALEMAQRIRREVEALIIEWEGKLIEVRASIGVAASPECAESPATLLEIADTALYHSKEGGRNRVTAAPYAVPQG